MKKIKTLIMKKIAILFSICILSVSIQGTELKAGGGSSIIGNDVFLCAHLKPMVVCWDFGDMIIYGQKVY